MGIYNKGNTGLWQIANHWLSYDPMKKILMMHSFYKIHKCSNQLKPSYFKRFPIYTDNEIPVKIYERWTEEEKLKLKTAYENYEGNWIKIAEELGTKNARQCRDKLKNLYADGNYKTWTKEEDSKLISLVEKYGRKWLKISNHFPQRSYRAVSARYILSLNPSLNKNELNLEQKQKLRTIYKQYPESWYKIAKIMNSAHSPSFLRDSLYKFRKDFFKRGKFTPEEDAVVIDFVPKQVKSLPMHNLFRLTNDLVIV